MEETDFPNESECVQSLLEPAVQLSTEDSECEQNEANFFPFDSLAVELNEDPEGAAKMQDEDRILNESGEMNIGNSEMLSESSPNISKNIYTGEDIEGAVADSTIPESNESSQDSIPCDESVLVKEEPIDSQEFQETNLEDFIYSNPSTEFEDGSNSILDDSQQEEGKKSSLYRFPKVMRAVQNADYEILQILYQLLYQRSAWDTQEILKQRILEFSGFNFNNNSEEYSDRDMMLKTQPNDVLIKIGNLLSLDQMRNVFADDDKSRQNLIAAIMQFLTGMKFLNKSRRRTAASNSKNVKGEGEATLISKCGCRSRCLGKTIKVHRRALLQYVKQLESMGLLDSYLFNLMEIKRHERIFNEDRLKIREVAYLYKVRMGPKVFTVCKGGFAIYHGLKQRKLVQLQNRLKTGTDLPLEMDMKDFPPFPVLESPRKISPKKLNETDDDEAALTLKSSNKQESQEKVNQHAPQKAANVKGDTSEFAGKLMPPRRRVWEKEDMVKAINAVKERGMGCASASKTYNVPRSTLKRYSLEIGDLNTDTFVDMKLGQRPIVTAQKVAINSEISNDIDKEHLEKEEEDTKLTKARTPVKAVKGKIEVITLRDFPLVVAAIEGASNELLIDVHFLLFLNTAESDLVKDNILDFSGFSFDADTEEYDERNEFLQRMSFKIVGNVARSFSLAILDSKEETIKNILAFLTKPDESYLTATSSMPLSLSDVELDDIEGFSDSDESITCEVVEKKVECIDLISSGEESDKDESNKGKRSPKKTMTISKVVQNVSTPCTSISQPVTTSATVSKPSSTTSEADSQRNSKSGQRTLRDFETICKIVNTHPHEYLVDIYDLLYLKKHEPNTLRKDILDFDGFNFEKGSPEYVKRKQLLDRMLYNSVRRIYNTLIHNTTEVKVFSKPTMITEIFQFLFRLPEYDTSVRPPPVTKPVAKPSYFSSLKNTAIGVVPPTNIPSTLQSGKLSDLKRVFQRVACFPCEYLIDVHKLLFMTDCDPKVIRQNIFAFKGFKFGPDSSDFQQRKMYLEYLTFHSLRKISSVLTTRSVDLRNSTKHELATHLTQVLAEYCNTYSDTEIPEIHGAVTKNTDSTTTTVTSSSDSSTPAVETIVVTPTIDPSLTSSALDTSLAKPDMTNKTVSKVKEPVPISVAVTPKPQQTPVTLAISIVDARSISSPAVTTTTASNRRKRKNNTVSRILAEKKTPGQSETNQFADINLPEIEQYSQMYSQNLSIYNPNIPTITGITTFNTAGVPQTFPIAQPMPFPIMQPMQMQPSQVIGLPIISQVQAKQSEVIVPEKAINEDEHLSKKQKISVSTPENNEVTYSKKIGSSEESNSFHNKIRDAISGDDDEDCDKPLASLIGHPIDSVLRKNIVDIVEQTDLQDITINGVIQKIYGMYPKFDLSYRKEFIKSTLRSMLYKLGEQKNSDVKTDNRCTDSPDCSVTTTDIQDNSLGESPETSMECS